MFTPTEVLDRMSQPNPPSISYRLASTKGFTLVELLLVVSLGLLLMALVTPVVSDLLDSYRIRQSSDLILRHLSTANQKAVSLNQIVEVRFFQRNNEWTAVQTVFVNPALPPDQQEIVLPYQPLATGVVLDNESPLLVAGAAVLEEATIRDETLKWCSVRFTPTGTAGPIGGKQPSDEENQPLPFPKLTSSNNYFSVILKRDQGKEEEANGPKQSVVFQIYPTTGRTVTYKP